MRYWRVDDPDDVRSSDVITGPPINPCPVLNIFPEQRRRRRALVAGAADDLWPFSTIRAGVLVLNHGSAGKLSDTIDFETPEGGATVLRRDIAQPRRYIFYAGGSLAGAGYCRQCRRRPAILLLQGNMYCQGCVEFSAQRPPRLSQFNAR